jgi:Domain of unknown function (DUF4263)
MKTGLEALNEAIVHKNTFDVANGEFSTIEIRAASPDLKFYYFYDGQKHELIKDFVLHEGPKVMTLCRVTLIHDGEKYSPRLHFWKKDKTKPTSQPGQAATEEPPDNTEPQRVKASVNIDDGHTNLWKLINYLQGSTDLSVPQDLITVVTGDSAQLLELFNNSDRDDLLTAVGTYLDGQLTKNDLNLLASRKREIERFCAMLTNAQFFSEEKSRLGKKSVEAMWQAFFEENPWIFGYGLNLISAEAIDGQKLEQITTGNSVLGGAGKRSDAVLRMRGVISSLLFCEIKRHDTKLLASTAYRPPDVYRPSDELVGAVSQVQKTADKALRGIDTYIREHFEDDGTPTGLVVATVRPRQVVVSGRSTEFAVGGSLNPEKLSSFEFYRRSILDTEIITFDELYERARFIVGD